MLLCALGAPLAAQAPDARTVPRGALRIGFSPLYESYDRRFSASGSQELLGTDLSADRAGGALFPTVRGTDAALQAITGDFNHRINIGSLRTKLDADIRRFPFDVSLGLTDRLTLHAVVPIVTTRMSATVTVDTAGAEAGWNQAVGPSGNAGGALQIGSLLGELESAAQTIETNVAAGGYGCPSGPLCAQAQSLAARVRTLVVNLTGLTGITPAGDAITGPLPPFAPTATSAAGQAVANALANVSAELLALGLVSLSGSLPLPDSLLSGADVNTVLTDPVFGYGAFPLEDVKLSRLGDLEVGARYALARRPSLRAVAGITVRLPTGLRDSPDDFVDIGTGDRQMDVIATLEGFVRASDVLSLAVSASYTRQFSDQLPRRVTSPHEPIALASTSAAVDRSLGDMLLLGAYPTLHLHPAFRVYGSVNYFRKAADRYEGGVGPTSASVLALDSEMTSLSYGAGVAYRSTRRGGAAALPIEAGLAYRAVFSGSGGFTPKSVTLNMYLRLYYRLFGGPAAAPTPPPPSPT